MISRTGCIDSNSLDFSVVLLSRAFFSSWQLQIFDLLLYTISWLFQNLRTLFLNIFRFFAHATSSGKLFRTCTVATWKLTSSFALYGNSFFLFFFAIPFCWNPQWIIRPQGNIIHNISFKIIIYYLAYLKHINPITPLLNENDIEFCQSLFIR